MHRITRIEAENVKRLRAVQIDVAGCMVVIGGDNEQGKSSVLDSIAYALGGKQLCPSEPIRRGAEQARAQVEIDDGQGGQLIVTRTWTAKGSYLKVQDGEGRGFQSPQAILDRLYSALSFDPLAFAQLRPAEQREQLVRLAGIGDAMAELAGEQAAKGGSG